MILPCNILAIVFILCRITWPSLENTTRSMYTHLISRYSQVHTNGQYFVRYRNDGLGVWSHVAVVFTGFTVEFYKNGIKREVDDTFTSQSPKPPGSGQLQLGRKFTGETKFGNKWVFPWVLPLTLWKTSSEEWKCKQRVLKVGADPWQVLVAGGVGDPLEEADFNLEKCAPGFGSGDSPWVNPWRDDNANQFCANPNSPRGDVIRTTGRIVTTFALLLKFTIRI